MQILILGIPVSFSIGISDLFLFFILSLREMSKFGAEMIQGLAGSKGELILYFKSKF